MEKTNLTFFLTILIRLFSFPPRLEIGWPSASDGSTAGFCAGHSRCCRLSFFSFLHFFLSFSQMVSCLSLIFYLLSLFFDQMVPSQKKRLRTSTQRWSQVFSQWHSTWISCCHFHFFLKDFDFPLSLFSTFPDDDFVNCSPDLEGLVLTRLGRNVTCQRTWSWFRSWWT